MRPHIFPLSINPAQRARLLSVRRLLMCGLAVSAWSMATLPAAQAQTLDISAPGAVVDDDRTGNPALSFSGDYDVVIADGVTLTGSGGQAIVNNHAPYAGSVTFTGDAVVVGDVGVGDSGALSYINAGAAGKTVQFDGDVSVDLLAVTGAGTVVLGADRLLTSSVFFMGNGALSLGTGADLDGTITILSAGDGTLAVAGNNEVGGTVGAVTHRIGHIDAAASQGAVRFAAPVYAERVSVGAHEVSFADDVTADTISYMRDGGAVRLASDTLGAFDFQGYDARLILANGVTVVGQVDSTTAPGGTILFEENGSISGRIGAHGAVQAIELAGGAGSRVVFDNSVAAQTLVVNAGEGQFLTDLSAHVHLADDGMVTLGDDADLHGAITLDRDTIGRLSLAGSTVVSGPIGTATHRLRTMEAAVAGSDSYFMGDVHTRVVTLRDDGAVTFARRLLTDDVRFEGDATMTLRGATRVTNGVDMNGHDATLVLAEGAYLTGDVVGHDGAGAGRGTVRFTGNSGIIGALGLQGVNRLHSVSFAGDTGRVVQVQGDIAADDIVVAGENAVLIAGDLYGDLSFAADGGVLMAEGATISGTIHGTPGREGHLAFAGDGHVAGSLAALKGVQVFGRGKTVQIDNDFAAADDTDIGANLIAVGGDFTLADGQTLTARLESYDRLAGAAQGGVIYADGAAHVSSGARVVIENARNVYMEDGAVYTIVEGGAGGQVERLQDGNIAGHTALLTFAQVDDPDALRFQVSRKALSSLAATPHNKTMAATLDGLGFVNDPALHAVQIVVQTASSTQQVNQVLESLLPVLDHAAPMAVMGASQTVMGLAGQRLDALGGNGSGVSTGADVRDRQIWTQAFGARASQQRRDGIAGYDADTYGMVVGIDREYAPGYILGLAGSYAQTESDSQGVGQAESTIETYQLTMYGQMPLAESGVYLKGMAGYALNRVNSRRLIGALGLTAEADYGANQYALYAETGRTFRQASGLMLTPHLLAHYAHYQADNYMESGAGGAGLWVVPGAVNVFELGVGLNAGWDITQGNGTVIHPYLSAGYRYDLMGEATGTQARFMGGGPVFALEGMSPDPHVVSVGAGLKLHSQAGWEVSAAYDFQYRSDYDAHAAMLRAGYKF